MDEYYPNGRYIMTPLMWQGEIDILKFLLKGCAKTQKKVRVLEWGSGGSTVYFPEFLRNIKIDHSWTSIEGNASWHKKVTKATTNYDNIDIYRVPSEQYVDFPLSLGGMYDIIIVDGEFRRQCLGVASTLLDKQGAVFLHDAQIEDYRLGVVENFPYHKMFLCEKRNEQVCVGYLVEDAKSVYHVVDLPHNQIRQIK